MSDKNSASSTKVDTGPITVEELVRLHLRGKVKALERYDAILWKIRSGYVVVLYGLLTILGGTDFKLVEVIGSGASINAVAYLTGALSLSALLVDLAFLISKLRVVEAQNRLSDLALELARGNELTDSDTKELRRLFHLSGEAPTRPRLALLVNGGWPIIGLYLIIPAILFLLNR